jgi:tetratricopeptide (TPR) repeat protein
MRSFITLNRIIASLLLQALRLSVASGADPVASLSASGEVLEAEGQTRAASAALPDDGPRYDQSVEGQEASQFREAVSAFRRGQWDVARSGFDAFAMLYPESALRPATIAFNAEVTVLAEPTNRRRAEAVNQYRGLIRAYPKDGNTIRAEWRIGDLYREMEWLHEAQSAYETALGRAQEAKDKERAMLGLAVTFGMLGRWKDAEQAFQTIRKHTVDDRAFMHATRGLAFALYGQRREQEARPLYDSLHQRWPGMFRGDPVLLEQYCNVLFESDRMLQARDVCTLLVNLYPGKVDAGSVLVRVGDACRRLGQQKCAELFYVAAHNGYGESSAGVTAKLRLARMEQEIASVAEDDFLYMKVRGLMRGAPVSYLDDASFQEMYRRIASEHDLDGLGSEALFRLAEYFELRKDDAQAIEAYHDVTKREGKVDRDPWPKTAGERLTSMLKPRLMAALDANDDLTALTLFHWHGAEPERHYAGTEVLLKMAEIHRREGFSAEAVRLYQALVRDMKAASLHETALIGLGQSYLDQRDHQAAQKVLERAKFLYPLSAKGVLVSSLLVTAMRGQGNRGGAVRAMRAWLKAHPKDPERAKVTLVLARTLAEDRKSDEALTVFDAAAREGIVRKNSDLLTMADLLTEKRAYPRAIELYRKVLASHPDPDEAAWANVQVVRNVTVQKPLRTAPGIPGAVLPSGDPLLDRAVSAIQTSLRVAGAEEGD